MVLPPFLIQGRVIVLKQEAERFWKLLIYMRMLFRQCLLRACLIICSWEQIDLSIFYYAHENRLFFPLLSCICIVSDLGYCPLSNHKTWLLGREIVCIFIQSILWYFSGIFGDLLQYPTANSELLQCKSERAFVTSKYITLAEDISKRFYLYCDSIE